MPFTAFKSKIDVDTVEAILYSKGQPFEADCNIVVDSFMDKETNKEVVYFKLIINEARGGAAKPVDAHSQAKGNGFQPQSDDIDDEIPF